MVAGDGHDVVAVVFFQPGSQSWIVAVGFVCGEPAHVDTASQQPSEHACRQFGFGHELDIGTDSGLGAALWVVGPGRREVEFAVDQRPALGRHIGQEHAELTVLDPPSGAGVPPLDTRGFGALDSKLNLHCCSGHDRNWIESDAVAQPLQLGDQP